MKPLLAKRVENLEAQMVNSQAFSVRAASMINVLTEEVADLKNVMPRH